MSSDALNRAKVLLLALTLTVLAVAYLHGKVESGRQRAESAAQHMAEAAGYGPPLEDR